jgi:hypothetical protein
MSVYGIGGFFRGFSVTAFREGIFCSSYIALAPYLKKQMLERQPGMSESTAVGLSSILAGSFGATLSHPADTLKTCLQGSLFPPNDAHGSSTAARFHGLSGPRALLRSMHSQGPLRPQVYRGYLPRVSRIICCTYIYSNLTTIFENLAHEWDLAEISIQLPRPVLQQEYSRSTGAIQCEERKEA